jgi:energy-coupling factor transport system permease protein
VSTSLYVDRDTLLHRLDARAVLALAGAVFVAAYVFADPLFVAAPLGAAVLALAWAGALRNLRRVWFVVVALFGFGIVVWTAFVPPAGPVVVSVPVLGAVTERQLAVALGRSLRITAFIVGGLAFVSTNANEEIVAGLRGLGLPYAFCFAVGTALRLFPTFFDAAGTVRQAQEARGLDVDASNPVARLRQYVPLLVPVFMTAFRNVETQSMALEARGFDTRRDRTFYGAASFDAADWAATGLSLVVTVGVVALSTLGYGTV